MVVAATFRWIGGLLFGTKRDRPDDDGGQSEGANPTKRRKQGGAGGGALPSTGRKSTRQQPKAPAVEFTFDLPASSNNQESMQPTALNFGSTSTSTSMSMSASWAPAGVENAAQNSPAHTQGTRSAVVLSSQLGTSPPLEVCQMIAQSAGYQGTGGRVLTDLLFTAVSGQ
jgi:hypothetical protein